jgi:uroporphyrin-III C-methyltransferase/precorrin-2 dehydrogenase/sirohydrochlorin ferrochelatase
MRALSRLPVFFALKDKRTVIAGGSAAAAWKAELMAAAGARVEVFAADAGEEMLAVARECDALVSINPRAWTDDDFIGASLAIGACDDEAEAARFAQAARAASVPVNVIDKPAFCDFSFGSIVNRSPLIVGISTDGAAPVFAQAVRAKIEAMLPAGFARWAEAAQRWRRAVQESGLAFEGRRRFWQLFTRFAVTHPDDTPTHAEFDRFVAQVKQGEAQTEAGSVTLVGAGPGDAELLTLRAVRALQSADVILFDDLVSAEVLDFARREAKKLLVGKNGFGPSCRQSDINALMVGLAKSGKRVVRLKGGDPMIFGRAAEEIEACAAAALAVEVVPGITAAQGAASRLGVSLTERGKARRLQFVTAQAQDGELPADLDWAALTDPSVTTAIYMPTKTLAVLVEKALARGLDPGTPALAVARATRPDEIVIADTIAALPRCVAEAQPGGPLLVMIGHVFTGVSATTVREPASRFAQP